MPEETTPSSGSPTEQTDGCVRTVLTPRSFITVANAETERAVRYTRPLSVVLIDVNGLSSLEKSHGDTAVSEVMEYVLGRVRTSLRGPDYISKLASLRLGVLLPETSQARAKLVAEKLRTEISTNVLNTSAGPFRMNISVGIASVSLKLQDSELLLMTADLELYRAKRSGKNQICIAKNSVAEPTISNNGLIH